MNKKAILYILVILFIGKIQSQNFLEHFNIAVGVNLMNINSKGTTIFNEETTNDALNYNILNKAMYADNEPNNNETGFYIGLIYDNISISEKIKIQPEMRFVAVKDFNQLQIPITLKYEISESFNLQTGPNLGFLLDSPETIDSFNFAIDFGASYAILSNLLFEVRYNWGQTNLLKNGDSDNYLKINNFQIGLVYKLESSN